MVVIGLKAKVQRGVFMGWSSLVVFSFSGKLSQHMVPTLLAGRQPHISLVLGVFSYWKDLVNKS